MLDAGTGAVPAKVSFLASAAGRSETVLTNTAPQKGVGFIRMTRRSPLFSRQGRPDRR